MKIILITIFALLLNGCVAQPTFFSRMSGLKKEMKRPEMIVVLGKPTKIENFSNGSVLVYLNEKITGHIILPNGVQKNLVEKDTPQYLNHHIYFDTSGNCIGMKTDTEIYTPEKYISDINEFKKNVRKN